MVISGKQKKFVSICAVLVAALFLMGSGCGKKDSNNGAITDPLNHWQFVLPAECKIDPDLPLTIPGKPAEGLSVVPKDEAVFALDCSDSAGHEQITADVFRDPNITISDLYAPTINAEDYSLPIAERNVGGMVFWAWPDLGETQGAYLVIQRDGWIIDLDATEEAISRFGSSISQMINSFKSL